MSAETSASSGRYRTLSSSSRLAQDHRVADATDPLEYPCGILPKLGDICELHLVPPPPPRDVLTRNIILESSYQSPHRINGVFVLLDHRQGAPSTSAPRRDAAPKQARSRGRR